MSDHLTPILVSKHTQPPPLQRSKRGILLELTPKLPCLLLIDVSGSMSGEPIVALEQGLQSFVAELLSDPLTLELVELALITFGSRASIMWDFAAVDEFHVPELSASGSTAMGEAIRLGLDLIEQKRNEYDRRGIPHYQPIILLMTDGSPTDEWLTAVNRLQKEIRLRRLRLITIGLPGADMELLSQISPPGSRPIALTSLRFREMFSWLSCSMKEPNADEINVEPPADWEVP